LTVPAQQPALDGLSVSAIVTHVEEVRRTLERVSPRAVHAVVDAVLHTHSTRGRVYVLGNGGSASTASHFACDLAKSTAVQGRPRLRVTALTDSPALLTAWANDAGYDVVFAEPLSGLLDPGDLVVAISASGSSRNVLEAVRVARSLGACTVGLTGRRGARLVEAVDLALVADSADYGVIEDCHLGLQHAITAATRAALHA
jgi:D-sedoheptulose 7-phosphate isomerase